MLEKLGPLIRRDGCYFVNLQYGDVDDEIARFNGLNAGIRYIA